MRTIRILTAAIVMGLGQNAGAVTVLVDAVWVRAGFGSAGDRCLDNVLLDLKPGDRLDIIMPALDKSATLSPLVDFTLHRRPSVRSAELVATRRLLNRVLATADPTDWPSLTQILAHLAASPSSAMRGERRYIIVAALTAADPPAIDLALQRLLRGRHIIIVNLARLDSKLHDARLKAWRGFFTAAGAMQLDILPLSALSRSKPPAGRAQMQALECSGRRLQVLNH